jgi:hypothetical protein
LIPCLWAELYSAAEDALAAFGGSEDAARELADEALQRPVVEQLVIGREASFRHGFDASALPSKLARWT